MQGGHHIIPFCSPRYWEFTVTFFPLSSLESMEKQDTGHWQMKTKMPSLLLINLIKSCGFISVIKLGLLLESPLTSCGKKWIQVWREAGSVPAIFPTRGMTARGVLQKCLLSEWNMCKHFVYWAFWEGRMAVTFEGIAAPVVNVLLSFLAVRNQRQDIL